MVTTVHAATATRNVMDVQQDWRGRRGIREHHPVLTGAAKAVGWCCGTEGQAERHELRAATQMSRGVDLTVERETGDLPNLRGDEGESEGARRACSVQKRKGGPPFSRRCAHLDFRRGTASRGTALRQVAVVRHNGGALHKCWRCQGRRGEVGCAFFVTVEARSGGAFACCERGCKSGQAGRGMISDARAPAVCPAPRTKRGSCWTRCWAMGWLAYYGPVAAGPGEFGAARFERATERNALDDSAWPVGVARWPRVAAPGCDRADCRAVGCIHGMRPLANDAAGGIIATALRHARR